MKIIETCPICGHDLVDLILTSNPPIPQKKCFNCGWRWTGEREGVVRVPFGRYACTNRIDEFTIRLNDYINTDVTMQINTLKLFPHLCKNCSEKLDVVFENFRETKINRIELIAKYRRLNQERREKLGTKG